MDERLKKHKRTKIILRIIGLTLLGIGLILAIIGFVDFILAINGNHGGPENVGPTKFWMLMVGIPFIPIGLFLTIFSFHREIAEYTVHEGAPVFNMATKQMSEGISDIASATTSGVKEALNDEEQVICKNCGEKNHKTDRFCSKCGHELSKKCPKCGAVLQEDDIFCGKCGTKIE